MLKEVKNPIELAAIVGWAHLESLNGLVVEKWNQLVGSRRDLAPEALLAEAYRQIQPAYQTTGDTESIEAFLALPATALPSVSTDDDCGSHGAWAALREHRRNRGVGQSGPKVRCYLVADRDEWRAGRWVLA